MLAERREAEAKTAKRGEVGPRHLEDNVVGELKARAKRGTRSLKAEVGQLLGGTANGNSPEMLRDLADRISALTPDLPQTDSTELVRTDRGR